MINYKVSCKILLYAFLGALWSYSNIGYPLDFLSPVTLVPFLFFIRKEKLKSGVIFSLLFGTSFYLMHLLWMPGSFIAFFSDGGPGIGIYVIAWLITLVFSMFHGALYSAVLVLMKLTGKYTKGPLSYLAIPVIVTVVEFFYPKYWVDRIGYAAHYYFGLTQVADLFGVPFLTFLVVLVNASILYVLESLLDRKRAVPALLFSTAAAAVVAASMFYGALRISEIDAIARTSPKARIGVVQGNYSGMDKRDSTMLAAMNRTYNDLSLRLLRRSPDLIIWPESADPNYYDIAKRDYSRIVRVPVPMIIGTNLQEGDEKKKNAKYYNSLVFLSERGVKIDHYQKRKLLPFIEDFPIRRLNFVMRWYGFDYFTRGRKYKIFRLGNIKVAPDICYEDIIPAYIRKSIYVNGDAANLLVNATNNSWFGTGTEPVIHLRIVGFRSIENRRSYASATCTGYSSIYDPCGRPLYLSGLFTREAAVREVPLMSVKTVYEKGGWLFPYILGIILGLQVAWIAIRTAMNRRR